MSYKKQNINFLVCFAGFLLIISGKSLIANPELDSLQSDNNYNLKVHDGKLYLPLDRFKVSSTYGYRIHPKTNKKHFHPAIDLDARWGDPVYSAEKGKVVFEGWKSGLGYYVKIDHGHDSNNNTLSSAYAHLSKIYVEKGDVILAGQKIGKVGSTGRSTGAHLHFEVHQNNVKKNPAVFFRHHNLKQFAKYHVGGGRRMNPVASIEPIAPGKINTDISFKMPAKYLKKSTYPLHILPEIVLASFQSGFRIKYAPAPCPEDIKQLKITTSEEKLELVEKYIPEKTLSKKPTRYGVQVAASRNQLDSSLKNNLKQKYGSPIREDYDGEYYRYTLMSHDGEKFKNESEVRDYIQELNNDNFMGVISYKNAERITVGWE